MATFCHSSQSPTWSVFSDNIRIQGPPKGPSLAPWHPVSTSKNVIERVENVKSLGFYNHLFSSTHQDLPDSRGMVIVDRSIGRLPSHPHPSPLKEIPKILPQVSGVPVLLPTFRTVHSPPGLYHGLQRSQTPPIPGQLAD